MILTLQLFGLAFTCFCLLAIAVPYLQRKRDLITSWSIFLLGSANFVGISAWQAATYWKEFQISRYADLSNHAITQFILGTCVFYATAFYLYSRPINSAKRIRLIKWPEAQLPDLAATSIALALFGIFGLFIGVRIQFLGQILMITGQAALVMCFILALHCWRIQKANPLLLASAIFCFLLAFVGSVAFGSTRRVLLSVLLSVPIYYYWQSRNAANRTRIIFTIAILGLATAVLLGSYSQVRHRNKESSLPVDRVTTAIESAKMIPQTLISPGEIFRQGLVGSDAVPITLGVIELQDSPKVEQAKLGALKFFLSNPIPRAWWASKPEALGQTFPRDLGQWAYGYINWGPGIIGHGFADGGYLAILLYAAIFALLMRWFDLNLLCASHNPYLLALFVGISGQWIAMPRGDIGVFAVMSTGVLAAALSTSYAARLFFPTDPRTISPPAAAHTYPA